MSYTFLETSRLNCTHIQHFHLILEQNALKILSQNSEENSRLNSNQKIRTKLIRNKNTVHKIKFINKAACAFCFTMDTREQKKNS